MASFYSRYVPNGTAVCVTSEGQSSPAKRRKLEGNGTEPRQEQKRIKATTLDISRRDHSGVASKEAVVVGKQILQHCGHNNLKNDFGTRDKPDEPFKFTDQKDEKCITDERPIKEHRRERKDKRTYPQDQGSGRLRGTDESKQTGPEINGQPLLENGVKRKEKKRKKATNGADRATEGPQGDHQEQDQHVSIRSKSEKATKKIGDDDRSSPLDTEQTHNELSPPRELHGLEPLPQPPPLPKVDEKPTFSSLPRWLADPLRVDLHQSVNFTDLGLDPAVLEYVRKQGLERAFPVQSAVIPLLTEGPHRLRGDVCISAATGSGKTLAYVVPMVQSLSRLADTKLRGLIVVPTRELVKQAKEVCEACAAGTNVKIATALGSKSLFDEQNLLVERYEVYDPAEYKRRQDDLVDWSKVNLEDMFSEIDNVDETAMNFVVKYRSRVDILICTPGRLVDHIRSTKGFTLDDVQWLVIDEADRLLNESFQEWTDFVMPALRSRASYALQDDVLRSMRLELPERIVQKVILSATLTRDISKLESLKLRNPKLVIVGEVLVIPEADAIEGSNKEPHPDEGAVFNLPPTLIELAVPIGDGADKPLYLLDLLRTKVNVFDMEDSHRARSSSIEGDTNTSSSESSASDSEATSSSASSSILPIPARRTLHTPSQNIEGGSANNSVLIFTRSTESATRLSRLLSLLSNPISSLTATLTKSSTSSSTRKALTKFRQHKIRIIIATDRASRGLDLPDLGHVISYDVPTSMTTYVHRVGRTARAGKAGTAWTLLAHHEARWFWNEIGKGVGEVGRIVRSGKVQRFDLNLEARMDDGTRERYDKALKKLGEEVVGGSSTRKTS